MLDRNKREAAQNQAAAEAREREEMMRSFQEAQAREAALQMQQQMQQAQPSEDSEITLLAEKITQILTGPQAQGWQQQIMFVKQSVPNLEKEIAKEIYPLIANRTITEIREVTRRALNLVDHIHANLVSRQTTQNVPTQSIDELAQMARDSGNAEALKKIENLRQQQMQAEEDDSSEEEYYDNVEVGETTEASNQYKEEVSAPKEVVQGNAGMTPEMLEHFREQMGAVDSVEDQNASAFDEEERNQQMIRDKDRAVIKSKRRASKTAKQNALASIRQGGAEPDDYDAKELAVATHETVQDPETDFTAPPEVHMMMEQYRPYF